MSSTFTALGLEFDLTETILPNDVKIIVKNKETRIDETCSAIRRHLAPNRMSTAEATELRGRLVFSNLLPSRLPD